MHRFKKSVTRTSKTALRSVLCVLMFTFVPVLRTARAEKDQLYTSDDEFLPLDTKMTEEEDENSAAFLQDETLLRNVRVKGIKLLKEDRELSFQLGEGEGAVLEGKTLKYTIQTLNFPPRITVHLYGVRSEEKIFHFFKNLDILGIVCNPFLEGYYTEYVVFFRDWVTAEAEYQKQEKRLSVTFSFGQPQLQRGYGVRIADTKIDPLPQVIEIYNELKKFGLECNLLVASDQKTVVLESYFYETKAEAVEYLEKLENFGFKGKLAIRNYLDFPKPDRFDVVTEAVVTGEDDVTLKNLVYAEFSPQKTYGMSYSDIFQLTNGVFSPRIHKNQDMIADFYFRMSDMYKNYETDDSRVFMMALEVSIKIQELIAFKYPLSQSADDALWEMANTIREYEISDLISEEECYRKIISEYPKSIFREEAKVRLALLKNPDAFSN
jgi:hypothetical protein